MNSLLVHSTLNVRTHGEHPIISYPISLNINPMIFTFNPTYSRFKCRFPIPLRRPIFPGDPKGCQVVFAAEISQSPFNPPQKQPCSARIPIFFPMKSKFFPWPCSNGSVFLIQAVPWSRWPPRCFASPPPCAAPAARQGRRRKQNPRRPPR